jgi:glycosyltransferase involved in cell wall biosynthesis
MLVRIIEGIRAAQGNGWSCEILLLRDGPLAAEFAQYGTVHVLGHPWARGTSLPARLYRRFVDRPWGQPKRLSPWVKEWRRRGFSLIYNNTGTNGAVLPTLRGLDCPLVTHVHELAYSLKRFNSPASLRRTLSQSDHFLAVSQTAANELTEHSITPEQITVVPNFIPFLPAKLENTERRALRRRLGLPPDRPVVVGCGHIDWVKGTDLFVAMAERVIGAHSLSPPFFCWIGGDSDVAFARDVRARVRDRKLQDSIHFFGAVNDPGPWFAASNVVAVTSRIESFSMVALEASSWGRPVVGFTAAAGVAEFLDQRAEYLAPELDPRKMAAMISNLLRDPRAAHSYGEALRARVESGFLGEPRIQLILATVARVKKRWAVIPAALE